MTSFTDEHLTKMLTKVNGLLAQAEHPNTSAVEAETFREAAERIMRKYRIEEEQLRQTKIASGTAAKPVVVKFQFMEPGSRYLSHYYSLLLAAMHHVGVRGEYNYERVEELDERGQFVRASYAYVMTMVGFDTDVQLVQLLFTNLRLTFSEKLEPKIDPSLSDSDNVYRLRSSGMERPRIGEKMGWGRDAAQKVTKMYVKACKDRGEDPKVVGKTLNAKTFRESYADAFLAETRNRFRRMRATAAEESGALVLVGRQEAVDEAFYETYPHLRPKAVLTGDYDIPSNCAKCSKAKSGYCRDHKPRAYKERPFSSVGWTAGTHAAQEADLSRVTPHSTPRLSG